MRVVTLCISLGCAALYIGSAVAQTPAAKPAGA